MRAKLIAMPSRSDQPAIKLAKKLAELAPGDLNRVLFAPGGTTAIGMALKLDAKQIAALVRALVGVGLAEYVEPQYLRFDPAMFAGDLTHGEREIRCRVRDLIFFVQSGDLSGETAVKFECEPV